MKVLRIAIKAAPALRTNMKTNTGCLYIAGMFPLLTHNIHYNYPSYTKYELA